MTKYKLLYIFFGIHILCGILGFIVICTVPETDHNHPKHCQWCLSIGLDGKHGNHWANNGIVYDDNQKVQGDGNASTDNNIGQP